MKWKPMAVAAIFVVVVLYMGQGKQAVELMEALADVASKLVEEHLPF